MVFLPVMKISYPRTFLSLLAVSALGVPTVLAQTTNPTVPTNSIPGGTVPTPPPPLQRPGPMSILTLQEREELRAAHDKAMQQNPELIKKLEAARKAMEDAMIQVDPGVAEILKKIDPHRRGGGPPPPPPAPPSGTNSNGVTNAMMPPPPLNLPRENGMGNSAGPITAAELQRVRALRDQVKNQPEVAAAFEAQKNAKTPEERFVANKAFHKAMRAALIKADPTIEPLLQKFEPPSRPQTPPSNGMPPPPPQ